MTENRCAQLAAIKRDAAVAALAADVTAKNLDASSVDLLRLVKVRCRRRAPSSVRECPVGPPECSVRGSTRVPLEYHEYSRSTHEHH
jgi:hypothetical protein